MIAFEGGGLLAYVERVLNAKDVTKEYADKVRYCNRKFLEWLGHDLHVAELDDVSVNAFLAHLAGQKRPDTVSGYRRAILLIWNEAYRHRDCDTPPLRVRRVRCPRDVIEAYTHEELLQLLKYVDSLARFFPNGVQQRIFWKGAIYSAYSTGLRRGDLLRVKRAQIGADGIAYIKQSKTGYPVTVRFCERALEAISQMQVDDRALPWPYHQNCLSRRFRVINKAAGLSRGQFRWIRRSAGSYAEREGQGSGTRLLGHRSERIFRDHYEDPTIVNRRPAEPPPIGGIS